MVCNRYSGLLAAALALMVGPGCTKKEFTESVKLHSKVDKEGNEIANSGESLDPHLLTSGYEAYMHYCYGCHGEKGDGLGPASATMRPPPRNFTIGLFKFPGTAFGQLPVDSALDRTIRRGLHGTPMLPWDIPAMERKAIIAYLKTLSPRWKEEGVPPEVEISSDPWKGKPRAEALALGRQVYHVATEGAGCSGCHASYETRQDISDLSKKITGEGIAEFSDEMYRTALKESEYPVAYDAKGESSKNHQLLPPDFLFHKVKTAYPVGAMINEGELNYIPYTEEMQREDLYRTIAVGIGGAAMPGWKGVLDENKLWALVYYVQSLVEKRGTPEAVALRTHLEGQGAWTAPAPVPTPAPSGKGKTQAP